MKKVLAVALAAVMMLGTLALTGCSGGGEEAAAPAGSENVILVTSFGTSYNDSRNVTIGAIEAAVAEAYPDYEIRRAFTAQTVIDIIKERDGITIDNMTEALDRAVADGVKNLVVQPTHLMNGIEYEDVKAELENYKDKFESLKLAEPLLISDEDFNAVLDALVADTADYDDGKTAICYMGHGTHADSNAVYAKLQDMFAEAGHDNYFVGTVEAEPALEDVKALVEAGDYDRVVLLPLMVVAGDHASNDMAGDEEGTWKTEFEAAGYEVVPVLKGMGEIYAIQQIYVQHVQAAIDAE